VAVGRAALGVVAAALTTSCASLPPCPARGGPTWHELRTAHFSLWTDLELEDAQEALRGLERLRSAVLVAAWRRAPEPPGPIVVFLLRTGAERRVFVPNHYVGSFIRSLPLHQSFLVISGSEPDPTLTQGLVYAMSHLYGLSGKARWFDEGLAQYLATLTIDDDNLTYGQVDEKLFRSLLRGRMTSFENLWKPFDRESEARFYATSWIAVHYLFNHEAERFATFQRLLIETKDAEVAWRGAFPDVTADAMDERLAAYVFRGGAYAAFETRLPPATVEPTVLPLTDARVHALRALLYATMPEPAETRTAAARAELAEALRIDPREPLAHYVQRLHLHEHEDDLSVPKELIARDPHSPFGWFLLTHARFIRHETTEANEALEQLLDLAEPAARVGIDVRIARPD
jgi:hypothetical protein